MLDSYDIFQSTNGDLDEQVSVVLEMDIGKNHEKINENLEADDEW